MKKILLVLLLVTSMVKADAMGNMGIGYSKGDNGGDMLTGFASLNVLAGIALRLEYTKDFTEHKNLFSKEDVSRYGLFATYELALLPGLSVTPKIGLFKTDGDFTLKEGLEKVSDSETKFTYGVEVDYYLNNQYSLFLGYTDYNNDFDSLGDVKSDEMDKANFTLGFKLHL